MVADAVFSWVLCVFIESVVSDSAADGSGDAFSAALPIADRAGLLIPGLRNDLLDRSLGFLEKRPEGYFESSFYWGVRKRNNRGIAESISDFALTLAVSGLENGDFSGAIAGNISLDKLIMELLGLDVRAPDLDEMLSGMDSVGVLFAYSIEYSFPDDSFLGDELECNENYRALRCAAYGRIRECPRSAERMRLWWGKFKSMNSWPGGLFPVFLVDLDSPNPPAVIQIHQNLNFDSLANKEFSLKNFSLMFDACRREGLYVTASKLLNYFLVTDFMSKFVGDRYGADSDVFVQKFLWLEKISDAVRYLDSRVPLASTREAMQLFIEVYRENENLEEDDYLAEGISSLLAWIDERFSGLSSGESQKSLDVRRPYVRRIEEISSGNSKLWPGALHRRIIGIEMERDFNLGNKKRHDVPDDYPWAVSYHKVVESLLRNKLNFLFEGSLCRFVEMANRNEKVRGFEPFKAFRLIERADAQPSKYEEVVGEMARRGIRHSEAKNIMRDYMDIARLRNVQAHGFGPMGEANRVREWVVANLHRILNVFSIDGADCVFPDGGGR